MNDKNIQFGDKVYEVVEKFEIPDHHTSLTGSEMVETTVKRERTFFAWIPRSDGNKCAWLKNITTEETLHFHRKLEFDDGWSYQHYWSEWKPKWLLDKIL